MRQLFTVRFLAVAVALVLLAVAVDAIFGEPDQTGSVALAGPVDFDEDGNPIERRVDLIEPVIRFLRSDDFEVGDDGLTVGTVDAVLGLGRVMRIAPGTPGSIECRSLAVENRCVVFADMLGDAVVWFSVLPRAPRDTVELPPIVDLEDGYAVFENGWRILYPPVIERNCDDEDVASFSDFLRRFAPNSVSIVDLETQQVTEVVCGEEFVPPTTAEVSDGSLTGRLGVGPTTTVEALDPDVQAPDN